MSSAADRSWLAAMVVALCSATPSTGWSQGGAAPSAAAERGQILMLSSYQFGLPVPDAVARGVLEALREDGVSANDILIENLDLVRSRDPEHRANVAVLLRHKLAGRPVRVILAQGPPTIEFLAHEARDLFPDAAVVALSTTNQASMLRGTRTVVDLPYEVEPAATLRAALKLFPRTKHVFVVSGANDGVLPFLDKAKRAFAEWKDTLTFEYANTLPYEEMLHRVSALPPDSIVFYAPYFVDTSGRSFVPAEVAAQVSQRANAPVFGTLEAYLGDGIVGGLLYRMEDEGKQAAKVALDVLDGRMERIQPTMRLAIELVPMFDWGPLTRWHADVSQLPEGSVVLNRPPTLWGQYRAQVLAAVVVILLLTALLVALLVLNRRLRLTKAAANQTAASLKEAQAIARMGQWSLDHRTNQLTWSDAAATLFEVEGSSSTASYEASLALVHGEDRPRVDRAHREAVAAHTPYESEHRLQMKDGRVKWVSEFGRTLYDERGEALSSFGTVQDITERKRAEHERARLEEELRQAQKLESVGRLAGGVAHDFNNMLGVILGHAELAMDVAEPKSSLHEDLTEILQAARRSSELTRQLLAFARRQSVVPRVLNLNDSVAGIHKMLQRLIGEDVELTWTPGPSLWPVKLDPSQLDQILTNLCVNARDAIDGVGHVRIATENRTVGPDFRASHPGFKPGDYVRLTVSDDGSGMDAATLPQIFEPFFTTKALGAGTGLGLATVYGAVKQNGGFLDVASAPGRGTTFNIYLPRAAPEAVASQPGGTIDATLRGRETILLAEDEPAMLSMTAQLLEDLGYTVLRASTPAEAVRRCRSQAGLIELLVTDVVMPGMNGRDLARAVLRLRPNIRLLFISGYTADVIAHHGALQEGVSLLQKPFTRQELAAKVREVLDAAGRPAP